MSAGAGELEDDSMFVIPSISAAFGCCQGDNGFLGLGLYGTSGMGVDYDFGRITNTNTPQNHFDMMTELSVAKMTAIYAYRLNDSGFSVGAGPVLVLSRFRTDMLDPTFTPSSGDWDIAHGVGAIFGVNQRLGRLSLGGSYMSEQYMTNMIRSSSIR